jgi:hypothetical protein
VYTVGGVGAVIAPVTCVCVAVGLSAVIVVGGAVTLAMTFIPSSLSFIRCDKYTPPITTPVTTNAITNITAMPAPPLRCLPVDCPGGCG